MMALTAMCDTGHGGRRESHCQPFFRPEIFFLCDNVSYAQILHRSGKHIGGWDAARECPGAADSGSDDSTSFSSPGYFSQNSDSRGEAAFRHRGQEPGRTPRSQNPKR